MSYQVHNFQTGQIIEAAPVNQMDNQIQTNETEITNIKNKRGAANGYASLNEQSKVPASQIQLNFTDDDSGNVSVDFGT